MIKFPFTSMQQFNLDWIMQQLKKILDFMPLNGVPGDVLQRNVDGAAWMPLSAVSLDIHGLNTISGLDAADEFPVYDNDMAGNYKVTLSDIMLEAPVQSVNGQTGDVVISTGGLVDSVNGQTGTVVLGKSDIGLGNVDNVQQYSATNPPPYPVTSVNGQTGAVIVSGGGAVDSVNGQTGTVVLTNTDIGLGNVANVLQYSSSNPPPYPVTSVNGLTGDVIVSSGSGIDILNGTSGSCTLASHAGIGQASDLDQLNWRLSADKKWLMLYGFFTLVFNTTGDYTLIDLGGPSLNLTGATAYYYKGAATLVDTSGKVNFYASRGSSILRLSNNVIRISINDPGATGTYTVIVHPVLLQVDA